MDGDALSRSGYRNSPHIAVYALLIASLDGWSGNLVPGAGAVLSRTIDHLQALGDRRGVARLQEIAVTVHLLQQAAAAGDERGRAEARRALRQAARLWLEQAPMLPTSLGLACDRLAA